MRGKFRMWDYIVPPPRRCGLVQPWARMTGVGTERHTNCRERHWICDEWDMEVRTCRCVAATGRVWVHHHEWVLAMSIFGAFENPKWKHQGDSWVWSRASEMH